MPLPSTLRRCNSRRNLKRELEKYATSPKGKSILRMLYKVMKEDDKDARA